MYPAFSVLRTLTILSAGQVTFRIIRLMFIAKRMCVCVTCQWHLSSEFRVFLHVSNCTVVICRVKDLTKRNFKFYENLPMERIGVIFFEKCNILDFIHFFDAPVTDF